MYIGVYMLVCACPGVYQQMDKESVILKYNGISGSNKKSNNICRKTYITGNNHIKQNKPDLKEK